MLKKIESTLIWAALFFCLITVIAMIIVSKVYPKERDLEGLYYHLLKHVTIQTVVEDDEWSEKYPLRETGFEHYLDRFEEYKKSIESYCTTSFPGGGIINSIVSTYNTNIMKYRISQISSIGDSLNYVNEPVQNVIEFKDTINDMGIPFIYVQTPSQEIVDYYKNTNHSTNVTIPERDYCFTTALEKSGVDLINVVKVFPTDIVYDSTYHWSPQDGLICTKIIAKKLSNDYAFDIDLTVYDTNNLRNLLSDYQEIDKQINTNNDKKFILPIPSTPLNISLEYAEQEHHEGDFKNILINDPNEWDLEGSAYHNVFSIANSLITTIYNKNAKCHKSVLIIGDSFSWPVCSYLSLSCSKVTFLHNASFNGSIISYIDQHHPDIVLIVYNDAELFELYTDDAYNLK